MRTQTETINSNRSDSEQSRSAFSEMFPPNTYLTYLSEDGYYEMRWPGGAYIYCDFDAGLREGREFGEPKCLDIINVYDYANSEVTISTLAEFAEECQNYIQERKAELIGGEGNE